MTDKTDQQIWDELDAEDTGSGSSLAETLLTDAPAQDPPAELFEGEEAEPIEAAADDVLSPEEAGQEPEAKPDPIAELNASIAQLAQTVQRSVQETRQQVGGLSQQMQRVQAEAAAAKVASAPNGPSQAEIDAAKKDDADWDKLKQEYPEWAAPLEKYVAKQVQAAKAAAPAVDIEALVQQRVNEQLNVALRQRDEQQRRMAQITQTIEQAHPGWTQTINTPDFINWQKAQAPGIQALANSADPADAITMLNLFASTRPQKPAAVSQKKERLQASALPSRTVNPGQRVVVPVDDMNPDQYWAYLDRQEKAAARR